MKSIYFESMVSSEEIYKGKIFTVKKDFAKVPNGDTRLREVVLHPGGVVVLPVTDDNKIIMVKQFRYPTGEELIELPAGKLEPGENPDEAIKRELEEECGYTATKWENLGWVYSTPGFCNEKLYFYKAYGLMKSQTNLDVDEFLDYFYTTIEEANKWIFEGKIRDMKTVALLGLIGMNKAKNE